VKFALLYIEKNKKNAILFTQCYLQNVENYRKKEFKMKKLFCVLLVFAAAGFVFADITVSGHAPKVSGVGSDIFNQEIENTFQKALAELNSQLQFFKSPDNFLRAMGNSNVYSSHGATTRAYGGYKTFTAALGPTFGFQLPSGIASLMDDLEGLSDSLTEDGDINLGVNPNAINLNVGLNLGIFKLKKIYLGLRIGYFGLSDLPISDNLEIDDYSNFTFGATVNYQIIPSLSLAGLITWRGISLGSGLIYNRSNINMSISVDNIEQKIDGAGNSKVVIEKPRASVSLSTDTYTIPLEAITAIKLIFINIPLGIGADIAFGKTALGAGLHADIDIKGLPAVYTIDKKGDVGANGKVSNSPSAFNFKIMTGLGFAFGPVILDIPLTLYPANHGYNLGFTIGAVF
jgi:hypothetical protein